MKRRMVHGSVSSLALAFCFFAGCSHGGAPEGYSGGGHDASTVRDMSMPWGRPDLLSVPDLLKPTPRTTVSFATEVHYASDQLAFQIEAGRFNSDKYPDLIVSGSTTNSVYMNQGDGTFTVGTFADPLDYWQMSTADLNGDGLGDLVLTDTKNTRLSVALGKGDGTFNPATPYLMGKQLYSVVATDLNGDRALDLVTSVSSDMSLHVLLNNGSGVFTEGATAPTGTTSSLWLSSTDVNRDGKADVIVSNYTPGNVVLYLGNGDGTLQMPQTIATHPGAMATAFGDFNFDGNPDFGLVRESEMNVHIYLGHGDGTFTAGTPLMLTVSTAQGLRAADLNGDGILDLVAACAFSPGARVFLGQGDGTFLAEKIFNGMGGSPFGVVVADFNQDGLNDLALNDSNSRYVSVLINTTKP